MLRTHHIRVRLDFVIELPREVDSIPPVDVLGFIEGGLRDGTTLVSRPGSAVNILPHAKCDVALHRPRKKVGR